ncbi:MAG: hypothetical protein ABIG30_01445 [Candidatus Aenigmatarchaeota archaeon]
MPYEMRLFYKYLLDDVVVILEVDRQRKRVWEDPEIGLRTLLGAKTHRMAPEGNDRGFEIDRKREPNPKTKWHPGAPTTQMLFYKGRPDDFAPALVYCLEKHIPISPSPDTKLVHSFR